MEAAVNTRRVHGPALRAADTAPFAVAVAAVAAFSFLSGGYILGRSTPVAVVCLGLAAVWVWFLRRPSRPSVLFLAALAAFGFYTLWTGASVLWSFGPDLTWVAFNLTAFYLATVAVLGFTSVRSLQLRVAGYGYLAVATAVGIYAFLGKALPDVVTHAHAYARLDSPVGYWNVLALMMVMGLCVALALAGDRTAHPAWRALAAAAAVPMCFTFFFTFSRGGWIALIVALILYFAFTTTRLAGFFTLIAVTAPVVLVLWRVRGFETLFSETADDALRASQGGILLRWSLAAVLVAVGVQLVVALAHAAVPWPRWSRLAAGGAVLVIVGVVVLGGPGWFVHTHGGVSWVEDKLHALVTDSESGGGNAAGRLVTVTTNGRIPLWREAADQSRTERLKGTGAGTFPFTHYRFRGEVGGVVKHAHSEWFNVLSELGVVGLALFVVAAVLLVAAAIGNPFARRDDRLHPLLVAMQAGVIAFFVHISWDWDWGMAAVGTAVFVFIGASASYRATRRGDEAGLEDGRADEGETVSREPVRPPHRSRFGRAGWAPRVVACVALVLLALSWLPPYLSGRAENAALAAAGDGDLVTALEHARRAARLDPLAVGPLVTEAVLLQQQGRNREALATLRLAVALQPDNYEVWYQLGLLQSRALGRKKAARAAFKRALGLNPADSDSRYELQAIGT